MKSACESYSILVEISSKCGDMLVVENLTPICGGKDILEIEALLSADSRLKLCFGTNHLCLMSVNYGVFSFSLYLGLNNNF